MPPRGYVEGPLTEGRQGPVTALSNKSAPQAATPRTGRWPGSIPCGSPLAILLIYSYDWTSAKLASFRSFSEPAKISRPGAVLLTSRPPGLRVSRIPRATLESGRTPLSPTSGLPAGETIRCANVKAADRGPEILNIVRLTEPDPATVPRAPGQENRFVAATVIKSDSTRSGGVTLTLLNPPLLRWFARFSLGRLNDDKHKNP
jgi:hypothetical protein